MAHELWKTGDLITADRLNAMGEELDSIAEMNDRLEELELHNSSNTFSKTLTVKENLITLPTDASENLGIRDMIVNLPLRQEEKDGAITPSNPKPFIPYTSIDFLVYPNNANLIDFKKILTGKDFTWNDNTVTGTVAAFKNHKIKIPDTLLKNQLSVFCITMGQIQTKAYFCYHQGTTTDDSSYTADGEVTGTYSPMGMMTISGYYTPSISDLTYSPIDGLYFYIGPADSANTSSSDTITISTFQLSLSTPGSVGTPSTVSFSIDKSIWGGQVDFKTGEGSTRSTSGETYYLYNSADLNIESFVEVDNGSNYVICTRPTGVNESTRCSHYQYHNGTGLEFYFNPSDSSANYQFTIHDSRFTDEAAARAILGNRDNNINFAGASIWMGTSAPETFTILNNTNRIVLPTVSGSVAAKDGELKQITYYRNIEKMINEVYNKLDARLSALENA